MAMDTVDQDKQYELALGQNIYTPQVFTDPRPILTDRPYAGWLYGELTVTTHAPGNEEALALNVGIVGPAALAEPAQKFLHDLVDDPEPAGWDHQIDNEPALMLRYRRSWFLPLIQDGPVQTDVVPRAGFNLGNVFTDLGAGAVLRLGSYLPEQDLPIRIQPGLSGNGSYGPVRRQRFDWMVFAEAQGRLVARNIFLDGNTFSDSLSVDRHNFVWDLSTGFTLGLGQFSHPVFISFSVVWRGREFSQQVGTDSFGSALIGFQY
jgi:hypothetical protein